MFLSIMKYITGYLRIQVTGYAPERFLNLCSNHNILMWKLLKIENGYEFYITLKGFRELKPFLKKTRTRVRIIERSGLPFKMHRYRKRKLFFAGICMCAICLFLLSRYIWNIEIVGNTSVTDAALLSYLEENGYGFGALKSGIDCTALEEQIRIDYSNIIWTSAQISGTKLTIQIKENLVTGEDETDTDDSPRDIVADKDAVIESIVTRTGIPLVSAGTEVKKGDTLVSGCIEITDDSGESVNYHYVKSDADIYGYTTYEYSDSFSMSYTKNQYTGNTTKRYAVALVGKTIKLPWIKVSYSAYDKTTDYMQLNPCSDFYLPFTLYSDTYAEYEKVSLQYTKEEATELAKTHLLEYLEKLSEKDIQILEKNVMIDMDKKTCKSSGTISTREKIGTAAETEHKSIADDERSETNEPE